MIRTIVFTLLISTQCLVSANAQTSTSDALPWLSPIRTLCPEHATRVLDTVGYFLRMTNYRIVIGHEAPGSERIALQPRAPSSCSEEVRPLLDAILWTIGPDNRLVIDKQHHLISFEPNTARRH